MNKVTAQWTSLLLMVYLINVFLHAPHIFLNCSVRTVSSFSFSVICSYMKQAIPKHSSSTWSFTKGMEWVAGIEWFSSSCFIIRGRCCWIHPCVPLTWFWLHCEVHMVNLNRLSKDLNYSFAAQCICVSSWASLKVLCYPLLSVIWSPVGINIQQDLGCWDKIQSCSGSDRSCGANRWEKKDLYEVNICDKTNKQQS